MSPFQQLLYSTAISTDDVSKRTIGDSLNFLLVDSKSLIYFVIILMIVIMMYKLLLC